MKLFAALMDCKNSLVVNKQRLDTNLKEYNSIDILVAHEESELSAIYRCIKDEGYELLFTKGIYQSKTAGLMLISSALYSDLIVPDLTKEKSCGLHKDIDVELCFKAENGNRINLIALKGKMIGNKRAIRILEYLDKIEGIEDDS